MNLPFVDLRNLQVPGQLGPRFQLKQHVAVWVAIEYVDPTKIHAIRKTSNGRNKTIFLKRPWNLLI